MAFTHTHTHARTHTHTHTHAHTLRVAARRDCIAARDIVTEYVVMVAYFKLTESKLVHLSLKI